ncbi:MAG: hypothetical protein DRH70_08430 [Candidatus Coatesbacteria bacterium]|nr:MAG: hypothetical protein DRH70_08430 [Candidatus Coatesbacteria bacterium]
MIRDVTFDDLTVGDVRSLLVERATVIKPGEPIRALLEKMIEDPRTRHVYVVDDEGVLIGSVRMNTVVEHLFPLSAVLEYSGALTMTSFHVFGAKTADDLMNDEPCFVEESTSLSDMARILMREKINELPVVDERHRVIGEINVYEVIAAYLKASSKG